MPLIQNLTKLLIARIDEYLDAISEGMIVFNKGLQNYLDNQMDAFRERIALVDQYESRADKLRREIENQLYSHSLIPEMRGDVLGLLEHLDDIIDEAKETLTQFSIEVPDIPMELTEDFASLGKSSVQAGEELVSAARAFFRELSRVKDHIHKVYFYEKETDRIASSLKMKIFRRDMELSRKMHLRDVATHVAKISDEAENVADRLSIYTIKRSI
ncbi:MAG: DUF47 family protein [Acidobacteria bacterium]|nr:DUF47 family protein [Acidobacteriota bacterium]